MEREIFDDFIYHLYDMTQNQLKELSQELIYHNTGFLLPTDNLQDLDKAEFILENWDKIKIENIKL